MDNTVRLFQAKEDIMSVRVGKINKGQLVAGMVIKGTESLYLNGEWIANVDSPFAEENFEVTCIDPMAREMNGKNHYFFDVMEVQIKKMLGSNVSAVKVLQDNHIKISIDDLDVSIPDIKVIINYNEVCFNHSFVGYLIDC